MSRRYALLLAACAALSGAGQAAAATIEQKWRADDPGGRQYVYLTVYSAGPEETNDVHVVRPGGVVIEDYYCQIAHEWCFGGQSPKHVDLPMTVTDPGARPRLACGDCADSPLEVWLRDGDDRLRIDGWGAYKDLVFGMAGDDHLDVRDGNGGDQVYCGAGIDTVLMDLGDTATDCELRDESALP